MGHPIQLCSPEDEGPTGAGEPLLAVCLPLTHAKRSSMSKRCRPGLVPLPIADRIAQHEHGVDVLPTPAHAGPFEAGFDDSLVGTFDAPGANGPACFLIGGVPHVRFALLQIGQFLADDWAGIASGQPGQMREHAGGSLVFEPME